MPTSRARRLRADLAPPKTKKVLGVVLDQMGREPFIGWETKQFGKTMGWSFVCRGQVIELAELRLQPIQSDEFRQRADRTAPARLPEPDPTSRHI
jgi:hypothetical protein